MILRRSLHSSGLSLGIYAAEELSCSAQVRGEGWGWVERLRALREQSSLLSSYLAPYPPISLVLAKLPCAQNCVGFLLSD